MKYLVIVLLIALTTFNATAQQMHPLLDAMGDKLELKEFKKLTGLKCYQSLPKQVWSKKAEIAFYLDDSGAIEQVEIRPAYLEKAKYTANPLLGITTNMEFETCYSHLEKLEGTSGFSSKTYDRSVTFFYSPTSSDKRFYIMIYLGRDEDKILNVKSITLRKAK